MFDYQKSLLSLTEAIATLLRNGDVNFYQAFDQSFPSYNFREEDRRKVMMGVGSNLNRRRINKRYTRSRKVAAETSMPPRPVFTQEELGFALSGYPD